MDEIGQFIGQDTHLMLNLQTITENIGTVCSGGAWIVVTSQEGIDAVLGEVRASRANDFSKIQGRFKPLQQRGGTAAAPLGETLNYLIRNSFDKLGYLTHLSAKPQAEIKAVLSPTDVADLGFSLEAGQGNQQALDEVQGYFHLMTGANRQVILQDIVEDRFGRRPYGWPE